MIDAGHAPSFQSARVDTLKSRDRGIHLQLLAGSLDRQHTAIAGPAMEGGQYGPSAGVLGGQAVDLDELVAPGNPLDGRLAGLTRNAGDEIALKPALQRDSDLVEIMRIQFALLLPIGHMVLIIDRQAKALEDVAADQAVDRNRRSLRERIPERISEQPVADRPEQRTGSEHADILQPQRTQRDFRTRTTLPSFSMALFSIPVLLSPTAPTPRCQSGWVRSHACTAWPRNKV